MHIAPNPPAIRAGVQKAPKRLSKLVTVCMQIMKKPKKTAARVILIMKVFVCEFIGLSLYMCRTVLPGTQVRSWIMDQRKRHARRYFVAWGPNWRIFRAAGHVPGLCQILRAC